MVFLREPPTNFAMYRRPYVLHTEHVQYWKYTGQCIDYAMGRKTLESWSRFGHGQVFLSYAVRWWAANSTQSGSFV